MAKSNNINNFQEIYERYKSWVYRTAYLIVWDHHKAEDITQDVFVRAYKSRNTFDQSKGEYSTWLRRITINQCAKEGRNNSKFCLSVEELEEKGKQLEDENRPFTERILLQDEIRALLKSLSNKYRAVLILRYYEGLNYSEIAEFLGIPLGTVKSRINAAISSLEQQQKEINKDT
ncbi:RNA polymerase sigma factor [Chloroflexota bacterium]